jgi:malate synthase
MKITGTLTPEFQEIITPEALQFVEQIERTFGQRRRELIEARAERQKKLDAGEWPQFRPDTAEVRAGNWKVGHIPPDLQSRHVEITGPTERKMMINALNSGASVFMADFEDANSPTWENMIQGHLNLRDAIERTISLTTPEKTYKLNDKPATLFVRPRGWHLTEKHALVDEKPISASFFDFGLFLFHNASRLADKGSGPYFYLPKLESHLEARLWNDVFNFAQDTLGIPRGTIKVTVLIETILAAFEMDEILYELRDHIAALECRALGLHLQHHQKIQQADRFHSPRPRTDHNDRAVHARLHRTAGEDLSQTRSARHWRHGGIYPKPQRPAGQ